MGPPCGTFSRAREKPIPQWMRDQGVPRPQPLRSEEFPLGLPDLSQSQLCQVLRVDLASQLAIFCAELAIILCNRKVLFSIENPGNSLIW
eukprot:15973710-Heterocapsa_arctica.AAC.1